MGPAYSFHKLEACFLVRSIGMFEVSKEDKERVPSPCLNNILAPEGKFSDITLLFSFCIKFWFRRILSFIRPSGERKEQEVICWLFSCDAFLFSSRSPPDCWNITRRQQIWNNDDRWCKRLVMILENVIGRGGQWGHFMRGGFIWNLRHQCLRKMAWTKKDCKEKSAVVWLENRLF